MPRKNYTKAPGGKAVDQIRPEDMAIFARAAKNFNHFTNHYLRSPTSGTYWRNRAADDPRFDPIRQKAWELMYDIWKKQGSPDELNFGDNHYAAQMDGDRNPVFFHNHGFICLPWQLQVHHTTCPEVTIVAGVGTGKTLFEAISNLGLAATIPNYRGICLAPQGIQVQEVYQKAEEWLSGTPFAERWITSMAMRPHPHIVVENSYVGKSRIDMYSIEDDPKKVFTLECDKMMIDQAEKFNDLDEVIQSAGTRLRGQIQGREKLGQLLLFANAGDNPELWYRYDLGELEPQFYLSLSPKTIENTNLTKFDLDNLRRRSSIEGDEEEIDRLMNATRPMGSGEHFSRAMVKAATNNDLNNILEAQHDLEPGQKDKNPLFVYKKTHKLGLYHFAFPPETKVRRDYIVIGDPGTANPPDRNTGVVGVWDVTNFPGEKMRLVALDWVFGHGSIWPWVMSYQQHIEQYHAQGRNAFDSTGTQKGYDELVFADLRLAAEGMGMEGTKKYLALNALKYFLAKGLMEWPYVAHLNNQLTNYRLPDTKIRQDLVSMCAMAAAWARRLYYFDIEDATEQRKSAAEFEVYERNDRRLGDRNSMRSEIAARAAVVNGPSDPVKKFGLGDFPKRNGE